MLFVFVVLCSMIYMWYNKKSRLEPPVVSGRHPIFGHALLALDDSVQIYKCIERISEECQEKGGIFRAFFGPVMVYGITDPEDALTVSNMFLQKHFVYDFMKVLLKDGLLTADVQTWKKNRKLLNPAFSPQVLVSLLEIFNSQARQLLKCFAEEEGKPFDHEKIVRMNNLETICMSAFGADAKEFGELQEQYLPHWNTALSLVDERLRKPWFVVNFLYNMTSMKKTLDRHVEIISELAKSIINKKINGMKNATVRGNETELNPFIKTILKLANEGHLTDEEVRGEIDTIIAAGHETTASAVSFVLTLLGSYPEVQEKAYQEIFQIVGDSDRDFEKEDLAQLTYVDAVIKETLRLYPIVPVIGRKLDRDIKLKNYTLKANHGCFISICGILRDKAWGPDRYEFRPDRWLDKDTLPDPKYFAAFGLGRRFCIGRTYAMMSIKVTLAQVLRQYKISSDASQVVVRTALVIRPASGHQIVLQKRTR